MFNSNNAKDSINDVKDSSNELAEKLKDSAKDVGNAVKQQLSTSGRETLDKADEIKEGMFEWVKSNPGKTIGIAFLAGWLFSKKD